MLLETIKELEKLTEKHIMLVEAIDPTTVLGFLNSGEAKTLYEILAFLEIQPSSPPNGQQVAVYNVLKKGLLAGTVQRVKDGKSFKYSKGTGVPSVAPVKSSPSAPIKPSPSTSSNTSSVKKNPRSIEKAWKTIQEIKAIVEEQIKNNPMRVQNTHPGEEITIQPRLEQAVTSDGNYFYLFVMVFDAERKYFQRKTFMAGYRGPYEGQILIDKQPVSSLSALSRWFPKPPKGLELRRIEQEENAIKVINSTWRYEGTWEEEGGRKNLGLSTGDRGPRTDHHGGDDGEGWMSSGQIRGVAEPYHKKWDPRLKEFAKQLREKGIKVVETYMDYGEKGHISLQLRLK